ncbi:MAG: aminotransferase class V-fold PLP-dependent enzyme [bacterium]|nr:aminotransferase class V-fold PLP-dependent enzyme [bacterium]
MDYKKLFPFYDNNPGSVYLDTACMGLKPRKVIDSITRYYTHYSVCAGRAPYALSRELSDGIEESRSSVASLINARSRREIIFTRNTSESINILANIFPFKDRKRVIITEKEHNSNHCVWKKLEEEKRIKLTILDVNDDNTFNLQLFEDEMKKNDVALVSLVHISNLDGIENPIKDIAEITHRHNGLLLVDGAQSVPHARVNVQELGIDFFAFSMHKVYGPTGIGILYVRNEHFRDLALYNVGGDTIRNTYINKKTEYRSYPYRYEAGLQDFANIYACKSACEFVNEIGYEAMEERIEPLNCEFREFLRKFGEIQIIGDCDISCVKGITTFVIKKFTRLSEKNSTVGEILDRDHRIMLRTGFFCVNPFFDNRERKKLLNPAHYPPIRVSFGFYNDKSDLDILKNGLTEIIDSIKDWPVI